MTSLVVFMLLLLLTLAVLVGAVVVAGYSGVLRERAPELSDRLAGLAGLLDVDAAETAGPRS